MADAQKPAPLSGKQKTAAAIAAAVAIAAPLTASFEGLRTHPYHDPAPKHTLTVCYGDTNVAMRVYTRDECLVLLEAKQRQEYAPGVLRCTPAIAPMPNLFASAIDAAYNSGGGNYCRSPMAAAFQRRQWAAGCVAYRGWHTLPGTAAHNGLARRREAERSLCLQDVR
jgi:lysozyme